MSGSTAALSTLIGVACILGTVAAIVVGRDALYDRGDMPAVTNTPTPRSAARSVPRPIYLPPVMLSHDAPEGPITPDEAHIATQLHCYCAAADCEAKSAALDVLIADGRMTPPPRASLLS